MAEGEEELKSLLMKVKEESEKVDLKLNIQKTKIMAFSPIQTRLSNFTFTFHFHALEKERATHSSVLAWRVPGMGGAWWAALYGVAQSRTRVK